MYASLEPRRGRRLDVYPRSAQSLIASLAPGERVVLGKDCFGASVVRSRAGGLHQTTPRIGDKPPGYRDVVRIDNLDEVWVVPSEGGWRACQDPSSEAAVRLSVKDASVIPPERFGWQWCTNTDIAAATNAQWIAYSADDSATIEEAFDRDSEACLTVGLKQYTIRFWRDEEGRLTPYGMQLDERRHRGRWIRRSATDVVAFAPPADETNCALCCEAFDETTHVPWSTTSCGHVFHATCLNCLPRDSRCPMCRTPL